ncbi:choice-of-anchor tandem repeat GloVer-containing protein [Alcanivorax sp. 24]|uniref:choice-of-anchor tandem repeat GloVer-containing protein n=1 Tax=Alcanivorax sp. 24 TaxID=2545266 RepID=UPI00105F8A45|nr:choice-of-anchor tandem repeat GloVer-containing protein [Alcanivorax sp. 24]
MRRFGLCLLSFCAFALAGPPASALEPTILAANGGPKPDGYEGVGAPRVPPLLARNGRLYGIDAYDNIFSLENYVNHSRQVVQLTEFGLEAFSGGLVQDHRDGKGEMYVAGFRVAGPFDELDTGRLLRLDFDGSHPRALVELLEPNGILVIDDDHLYGLDKGPEGNGRLFTVNLDAAQPALETVHTFSAGPQGQRQYPNGMILGSDGWLYGVSAYVRGVPYAPGTPSLPATPTGTVYRIDPRQGTASFEVLHTFVLDDGEIPWQTRYGETYHRNAVDGANSIGYTLSGLVEGPDGYVYGNLSLGICTTPGTQEEGWSHFLEALPLCHGQEAAADDQLKWYASDPPHYDGPNLHGSVYRVAMSGDDFAIVHRFSGGDGGSQPRGPMVLAGDGNIYGTTYAGGRLSGGRALPGEPVEPPADDEWGYGGAIYRINPDQIRINESGQVEDDGFELVYGFVDGVDKQGNVRYDGRGPVGLSLGLDGRMYGGNLSGGGYFSTSGSKVLSRTGTLYRLSLNPDDEQSRVTVTITPGEIEEGGTALLEWSTVDASNCTASGGNDGDGWAGAKDDSGFLRVSPEPGTHYYTLTCESTLTGGQVGDVASLGVGAPDRETDEQVLEYGNGSGGSPSWWLLAGLGVLLAARSKRSGRR